MSLTRYNIEGLRLKNVCISGQTGKSVVFEEAARLFLDERDWQQPNVNLFYYIPQGAPYQICLTDVPDFDGSHADELTTLYRHADCIILVYDPVSRPSLEKVCKHFNKFIHNRSSACVLLLRNLHRSHEESNSITVTPRDEVNFLSTVDYGNLLGRQLHSINSGRYYVYSVLGQRDNSDDVRTFFETDLMDFFSQLEIQRNRGVDFQNVEDDDVDKDCWYCLCKFFCCCCDNDAKDDQRILVRD